MNQRISKKTLTYKLIYSHKFPEHLNFPLPRFSRTSPKDLNTLEKLESFCELKESLSLSVTYKAKWKKRRKKELERERERAFNSSHNVLCIYVCVCKRGRERENRDVYVLYIFFKQKKPSFFLSHSFFLLIVNLPSSFYLTGEF